MRQMHLGIGTNGGAVVRQVKVAGCLNEQSDAGRRGLA